MNGQTIALLGIALCVLCCGTGSALALFKRGQVASFFKGTDSISFAKKYALKRMLLNNKVSEPNFISYQVENIPNRYVKKYSDLPLIAWCVRSEESYLRVKKFVDNIIFENIVPEEVK